VLQSLNPSSLVVSRTHTRSRHVRPRASSCTRGTPNGRATKFRGAGNGRAGAGISFLSTRVNGRRLRLTRPSHSVPTAFDRKGLPTGMGGRAATWDFMPPPPVLHRVETRTKSDPIRKLRGSSSRIDGTKTWRADGGAARNVKVQSHPGSSCCQLSSKGRRRRSATWTSHVAEEMW
jgi:hypothetical protein